LLRKEKCRTLEIIEREMPLNYVAVVGADKHIGSLNCHIEGIIELRDYIIEKDYYYFENGDGIEGILPTDKRFQSITIDWARQLMTPKQQTSKFVEIMRPVAKRRDRHGTKFLAKGFGNHEWKLINTEDFAKTAADELGVPYGCVMYKFVAKYKGEIMHKFLIVHGKGQLPQGAKDPIQRKANREAAVKRKLERTGHGDCIAMIMSHVHECYIINPTSQDSLYLTDQDNKIKQHYMAPSPQNASYIPPESRWYASTPGFRKSISPPGSYAMDYGEMGMFSPTELGWLELHVKNGKLAEIRKRIVGHEQ
jgi:hypothetical protein